MLLNLLAKEEKYYFVDLLTRLICIDGEATTTELSLVDKLKYEMGEDMSRYRKGNLPKEKLIEYFSAKPKTIKNLVFMNLAAASLNDDWYSVEEHFLLEQIQQSFQISEKKRSELIKLVYAERDLREKTKRVLAE